MNPLPTSSPSEQRLLDGLRIRDSKLLTELYEEVYPKFLGVVTNLGASEEEAKDLFQESMVVVYRKSQDPQFVLTSKFSTYVIGVGKLIWRKKRKQTSATIPLTTQDVESGEDLEEAIGKTERFRLYRKKFSQLGKDCQRVLTLYFSGESMLSIAQQLGYSSEGYAKKRKYTCKKKLTELIKSDPVFQELVHSSPALE